MDAERDIVTSDVDERAEASGAADDAELIEEISIDGMCGVY